MFLSARRAAGPAGPAGSALARQLAALLPARTAEQVAAHERWHREASRLQSAAQQADAGARDAADAFLAAAPALVAEAEGRFLEQASATLQQLEAAAASLQAGDSLQHQRAQRAEAVAAGEVARFEAAAAAAAQEAERRRQELNWRDRMKQLLVQHQGKRAAEAAATAAAEQAAAAAAARDAAAAAALGRQRVACRAALVDAKRACRAQQEARRQQERERRQAAQHALASKVAPAVQRDTGRATRPTESSAAAAGVEQQRHGLFERALGFTTDQLLADQRFKVGFGGSGFGVWGSKAGGWSGDCCEQAQLAQFVRRKLQGSAAGGVTWRGTSSSAPPASCPGLVFIPPLPVALPNRSTKRCGSWACTPARLGGKLWWEHAPQAVSAQTCSPQRSGRACAGRADGRSTQACHWCLPAVGCVGSVWQLRHASARVLICLVSRVVDLSYTCHIASLLATPACTALSPRIAAPNFGRPAPPLPADLALRLICCLWGAPSFGC